MTDDTFSKLVLDGLTSLGFGRRQVAKIVGLKMSELLRVYGGGEDALELTDPQIVAIERATSMTGGQIALLGMPKKDKKLAQVINALAESTRGSEIELRAQ